jgi:O-antigen/teichoic acid export membrane protein
MYGSSLIGLLLLIPNVKKHIDLKAFSTNFFKLKNFNYLLLSFPLYIPQLGIDIYNSIDRSFIGYMVNETEVGYYEMSQKLVRVFLILITSLGTVLMPKIAGMIMAGDKIKPLLEKSVGFTLFLTCGLLGFLFVMSDFIVIYFLGERFLESISLLKILAFILLPISLGSIIGTQYMLPAGMDKEYKIPVLIGVVVNVVLNLFLIKFYSSNGAAIASVISEFVVVTTMIMLTYKKINFLKLINTHINFFKATIISVILSILVKSYLDVNLLNTLILGTAYVSTFFLLSYFTSTFLKKEINSIVKK